MQCSPGGATITNEEKTNPDKLKIIFNAGQFFLNFSLILSKDKFDEWIPSL